MFFDVKEIIFLVSRALFPGGGFFATQQRKLEPRSGVMCLCLYAKLCLIGRHHPLHLSRLEVREHCRFYATDCIFIYHSYSKIDQFIKTLPLWDEGHKLSSQCPARKSQLDLGGFVFLRALPSPPASGTERKTDDLANSQIATTVGCLIRRSTVTA